jgi:hypothetical protein
MPICQVVSAKPDDPGSILAKSGLYVEADCRSAQLSHVVTSQQGIIQHPGWRRAVSPLRFNL